MTSVKLVSMPIQKPPILVFGLTGFDRLPDSASAKLNDSEGFGGQIGGRGATRPTCTNCRVQDSVFSPLNKSP
jgi:hypothetical protein